MRIRELKQMHFAKKHDQNYFCAIIVKIGAFVTDATLQLES